MSEFSRFMKSNKKPKENGKYAPTASLCDENGKSMEWEFRHLTSKEHEELRDECTVDVQVTGKPGLYRPKMKTSMYLSKLVASSVVWPDLRNAELQDSYGVKSPEALLYAMVDDAGEYSSLCAWVQNFQGLTKNLDDKVKKAKNS